MKLPVLHGQMARRFLVNFRVDPDVMRRQLPEPFRPHLHNGYAIAGICLIRLEDLRPRGWPTFLGLTSENAAHRFAVSWTGPDGSERIGVYIPRRDTDSALNHAAGGCLFPGAHYRADFRVVRSQEHYEVDMRSRDGHVRVSFEGRVADSIQDGSCFEHVDVASEFFRRESTGYSPRSIRAGFEGVKLSTQRWKVKPLAVNRVYSSVFGDNASYPPGSVEFDHALVMQNIAHEWHTGQPRLTARAE